ncbi:DUF4229 domain-containing protein [Microbacterium rhizosphaerae]|uniref:DUF4229 domain-containing protein n=1 Tax=Microbacterium rhizosphaerae TaxID=1678237 RepID=A0ABZ0SJW7_9MICO|nr:DUF4229 domain-containing protein [Microbacterium rhizosphaerae]WPR89184.1 DUF4229 domain-containing protein [Microbacterium rhizosphaerae]
MRIRSTLVYSVLRLLAFLVPFGIMMLFPVFQQLYWLAAVFAALIGLSLSMLFLRRPLNEMSAGIAERRAAHPRKKPSDEDLEDAADDAMHEYDDSGVPAAPADAPADAAASRRRDDQS